jgi:hypothetical protein
LRLSEPSLAWEYLRRNVSYRQDWAQRHSADASDPASRWQLEAFEDPDHDARVARPVWQVDAWRRAKLRAGERSQGDQEPFSLWAIAGPKRLVHDGRQLLLNGYADSEVLQLVLSNDVHDGEPFEYVLSPSADIGEQSRTVQTQQQLLRAQHATAAVAFTRPTRLALWHMRALQALDGAGEGASQREIAAGVFGEEIAVASWHPDSDLRAQVRHLLRRARSLMAGGYRGLIST